MIKSPFFVTQDFISPLQCETIINSLTPYQGSDSIFSIDVNVLSDFVTDELISLHYDTLSDYYDVNVENFETPLVFKYEGCGYKSGCDGYSYLHQKWVRTRPRDISCMIFLNETNLEPPFDNQFEIFGGKIDFPQHQFGFNHNRGALVCHPSTPHFIHEMRPVTIGAAYIMKWYIKTETIYIHDPKLFEGDYTEWFKEIG